jgi:glycosyltransferase involved in cell wall biosynthesis
MAEQVRDGVNGLHFRVRDPYSLADTIRRAVNAPELWDEIRSRIKDPITMDEHRARITGIYEELLTRAVPNSAAAA